MDNWDGRYPTDETIKTTIKDETIKTTFPEKMILVKVLKGGPLAFCNAGLCGNSIH